MNKASPLRWWQDFLALPNTHSFKTIGMAFLVALVCSFAVSLTAVNLKPLHDANQLRESAASLVDAMEALGYGMPARRLVTLVDGSYVGKDTGIREALDSEQDLAGLGDLEAVAEVYELYEDGVLQLVVLPVRGAGYQSQLKGYLVLEGDLNTVAALTFHEQNETPGMGAKIEEKAWQSLWIGKQVADKDGIFRLKVVRGKGEGVHEVDGISGATRTVTGISKLLQFWLGPQGFGPYLAQLKSRSSR